MGFTRDQILELYKSEAGKHGLDGASTIQDIRTRMLEQEAIFSYISDGQRVLEIGCGNGFMAQQIVESFNVDLDASDFSKDMIALAKARKIDKARGRVVFKVQDVLTLDSGPEYDLVFTERCIQNLETWDDQKKALANIAKALKPGALFVMLESFWTGLNNLNEAREELDLDKITPPWHNLFFDEDKTIEYMQSLGCGYQDQNPFLSGYYFGSRVLLPVLMPKGKKITSKSRLNDFFCGLPPSGDFCPMKIVCFKKK